MSNESIALIVFLSWCAFPWKASTIRWLFQKLRLSSRPGENPPDYRPEYLKQGPLPLPEPNLSANDYLSRSSSPPPSVPAGLQPWPKKPTGSPAEEGHMPTANPPAGQQVGTQMGQELGFLPSDSCTSSGPSGGSAPTRPAEKTQGYGQNPSPTSDVPTPSTFTTGAGEAGRSNPKCGLVHLGPSVRLHEEFAEQCLNCGQKVFDV